MTLSRIQELESLGFQWKASIRWEDRFQGSLPTIAKSRGTTMFLESTAKLQAGHVGRKTKE
jgi:hypothetical protein